jgi:hypothetical protein
MRFAFSVVQTMDFVDVEFQGDLSLQDACSILLDTRALSEVKWIVNTTGGETIQRLVRVAADEAFWNSCSVDLWVCVSVVVWYSYGYLLKIFQRRIAGIGKLNG